MVNGVVCKTIIREFDSHPSLKQKGYMQEEERTVSWEEVRKATAAVEETRS